MNPTVTAEFIYYMISVKLLYYAGIQEIPGNLKGRTGTDWISRIVFDWLL